MPTCFNDTAVIIIRAMYTVLTVLKKSLNYIHLNFLIQYSCRIVNCPILFMKVIKFPEVLDRAHFPSRFLAHVLKILMIFRTGAGNCIGKCTLSYSSGIFSSDRGG